MAPRRMKRVGLTALVACALVAGSGFSLLHFRQIFYNRQLWETSVFSPSVSTVSHTGIPFWPYFREKGTYQAKVALSGKPLWNVSWETKVIKLPGETQIEILEEGQGQPWRYAEPIRWEKRMLLKADSSLGPDVPFQFLSVQGSRWTDSGEPLGQIHIQADPAHQQILYQDENAVPGTVLQPAVFPWTPQALPDELLFHWARTIPVEQAMQLGPTFSVPSSVEKECTLLVSPTRQLRVQARLRGTETVATPAGIFSCYRVDLTPQLFGPLKHLAPRMTMWCSTDFPYYWVRYQGPIGGLGAPQAVIELVKFEQESG